MKYVFEFGVRGGMHSDNTILPTQKLAQELASRTVMVLTNKPDIEASRLEAWQFSGDTKRIVWQSPTHFVAISKLDGTALGAASSKLWKKANPGDADLSAFTYPESVPTPKLQEAPQPIAAEPASAQPLMETARRLLSEAQAELVKHSTAGYFVPSAPDTSKFQARVSGMAEMRENLCVPAPGGVSAYIYAHFLMIGSAIERAVKEPILKKFRDDFREETGYELAADTPTRIQCADGNLYIEYIHGTSWGGIGLTVRPRFPR